MQKRDDKTKIRVMIADLTVTSDGETSGSFEMSVTENGKTQMMRREFGRKPARRGKHKDAPNDR